jgi:hypothetical protein
VPCCGAATDETACASTTDTLTIAPAYEQGSCVECLALAATCVVGGVPCCSLGIVPTTCGTLLNSPGDVSVCL